MWNILELVYIHFNLNVWHICLLRGTWGSAPGFLLPSVGLSLHPFSMLEWEPEFGAPLLVSGPLHMWSSGGCLALDMSQLTGIQRSECIPDSRILILWQSERVAWEAWHQRPVPDAVIPTIPLNVPKCGEFLGSSRWQTYSGIWQIFSWIPKSCILPCTFGTAWHMLLGIQDTFCQIPLYD